MRAVVRRPAALLVALLALAATTSACVGMPEQGPVVTTDAQAPSLPDVGVERRAQPPQEGDSQQVIVNGFLQAMTAYPVNLQVAREFLTSEEQDAWDPSRRTVIYGSPYSQTGTRDITVSLDGTSWIDSRGTWRGKLGDGRPRLHFELARQNDEWRISSAPDAFVIPDDWFQDHYEAASVYYYDPTATILVPEQVLVPSDQRVPALVQSLLDGPGPHLRDVVRSFVPAGLTPGLSVPVDGGQAAIDLGGSQSMTSEEAKLMVYQFAWTLRQEPSIDAFTISIGGTPVTFAGSNGTFSRDLGSEYAPTEVQASGLLFAVRAGRLEVGEPETGFAPVTGAFAGVGGIESVGVSLTASLAAAVTDGGRTVLRGSVSAAEPAVVPVVSGASDLLRPSWDFADRMWLVDRTASGALVSHLDAGTAAPVAIDVPGISGTRVREFIVSRDGSRLVAVVAGPRRDELRIARIKHDSTGAVIGATRSRALPWSTGDTQRILDIGWYRSPTQVAVLDLLTRVTPRVVSVSVDGAGPQGNVAQQDEATALVSSPENEPLYTRTSAGLFDLEGAPVPLPPDVTSVQYVG